MIISLLLGCSLMVYVLTKATRHLNDSRPTAGAVANTRSASGSAAAADDDPVRWRHAPADWTALDERQLIRLLTDSAP